MAKQPRRRFVEERPVSATLNSDGHETVDSRPLEAALHLKRPPTLTEQIRAAVRSEALRREAMAQGHETFEEADDFDIGDDYDPTSPYEMDFEPEIPTTQARPEAAPPSSETQNSPGVAASEPGLSTPQGGPAPE